VIAGEELAASAWRRKWKCATCSETGSYESTGGARKGCTSYKADALEPQLARAGGDGTGARARGIALREIDTREGVRALGSLAYLRVRGRDERSRRFGVSERTWLEQVDRRGLSGRRNETGEGCRES
jgi:hypothetical protein